MNAPRSASVTYEVIGIVRSPFTSAEGMPLQSVAAADERGEIDLHPKHRTALQDLDGFSHLWVVSHLHQGDPPTGPVVLPFLDDAERGLFATRSPRHPNPIGLSVVRLLEIEDATLHVEGLDLLDGTPVLDLKPYVPLFDCIDAERIGWLTHRAETVHTVRADRRFEPDHLPAADEELLYFFDHPDQRQEPETNATPASSANGVAPRRRGPSVRDVMRANPKTLPRDATVGAVRGLFENPRVRLALLVHRGVCTGTIALTDITAGAYDEDAAAGFAQAPQTIHVDAPLADAHHRLAQVGTRRLVVIDDQKRLQGLLCLNRAGNGFCNARSHCGRQDGDTPKTRWQIIDVGGPAARPSGVLLAPLGKTLNVGDLLDLPRDTKTRWLVLDVQDEPQHRWSGIAAVEALDRQ
jgi:tRNA-Thr(GGU) m(6)t(6)A37 methyltransferase TsaA